MKIEDIQGEFYHNTRKMAEEIIRLRELIDIAKVRRTQEQNKQYADEIMRLSQFINSITDASGPYQDLNGHKIVQDAYKVLKGE